MIRKRARGKIASTKGDEIQTPLWLAYLLVEIAFRELDPELPYTILEPCAGKGRLSIAAKLHAARNKIPINLIEFEITKGTDYLCQVPYPNDNFPELIFINPPFSNLGAIRFIKHSLQYWCNNITEIYCIVPNTQLFQSERRFPMFKKHLIKAWVLPRNCFKSEGCDILDLHLCKLTKNESGMGPNAEWGWISGPNEHNDYKGEVL